MGGAQGSNQFFHVDTHFWVSLSKGDKALVTLYTHLFVRNIEGLLTAGMREIQFEIEREQMTYTFLKALY